MGGLAEHLKSRIAKKGPLTVAQYMEEALGHPRYGYYMASDPFGANGDFTTAPEISQIFGELIGLWCAVVWRGMGAPSLLRLAELGPGRGTLLADAMRAGAKAPGFVEAVRLHLIETSPVLRRRQQETLKDAALKHQPSWHEDFDDVPDGSLLVIANEFFDALPVRQFQRTDDGWAERLVDADPGKDGGFRFVLSDPVEPDMASELLSVPSGSLIETCAAAKDIVGDMARRVSTLGGAALIVDYGHAKSAAGETMQAVKDHAYHDPLDAPGDADLTAHVDFGALSGAALEAGASVHGPLSQGAFLENLGIHARAEALIAAASGFQAADIRAAVARLTSPGEMGTLFKVMAITHPELAPPPGF